MDVALYARISLDRTGEQLGVDRQLDEMRQWVAARGWTVAAEHVDNSISATTGKERPAFERLLASEPEAIVCWHTDRLVRVTRDLERVIDLGVNVHALHAGHLDLSTPAGRAVARTITTWATYEGEHKAERQRAANRQRATDGRPTTSGPRPFGYRKTKTRLDVEPAEADAIRAAYRTVLEGGSLKGLARSWNEAGFTTTRGNRWTPSVVRRLLANPLYAALTVHRGTIVGRGTWEAIVDETTYRGVAALLRDPSRRTSLNTRPRYLLTNIVTCGKCGAKMATARTQHGVRTYKCTENGDLSRAADPIDALVTRYIVERLRRPDIADLPGGEVDVDLAVEKEALEAQLEAIAVECGAGRISVAQMVAASAGLRERVEAIEQELARQTSASVLGVFQGRDPQEVWNDADLAFKRSVVQELTAAIVLDTPGRGAKVLRPETVRVEWRVAAE